jgi:hypothetical protein
MTWIRLPDDVYQVDLGKAKDSQIGSDEMFIVSIGDVNGGFQFFGPFLNKDEAWDWINRNYDRDVYSCVVTTLTVPKWTREGGHGPGNLHLPV